MSHLSSIGRQIITDESGQDLIEYALAACLLGLSAIAAMQGLATRLQGAFSAVGTNLTSAV